MVDAGGPRVSCSSFDAAEAKAAERRRTPKRKRVNALAMTATLWTAAVLCRFLLLSSLRHSFAVRH